MPRALELNAAHIDDMNESRAVTLGADPLLTLHELSEYLDIPEGTLKDWRLKKKGPKGIKLGGHLRYRLSAVNSYLDQLAEE